MSNIVVALGGNALGKTPSEQLNLVKNTAKSLVDLIQSGNNIVITHGNGPQVGIINLAFDIASSKDEGVPSMPFAECGAMSQGYIGYHLQQAIYEELKKRNIKKNVATVITQVLVDKNDEAFNNPTKPIGMFYTESEAKKLHEENGQTYVNDSQRGFRRVVPSPKPIKIIELDLIKDLLSQGNIVIVGGGGGIPVIEEEGSLKGVDAVIDKDRTSSLLAKEIDADKLLILTAVDKVSLNYNKENQIDLDVIKYDEALKYIEEGQFAKGSMLPKVLSILEFIKDDNDKVGIISSLDSAILALNNKNGTRIIK